MQYSLRLDLVHGRLCLRTLRQLLLIPADRSCDGEILPFKRQIKVALDICESDKMRVTGGRHAPFSASCS